jgi:glycosyltransferase involved in cell wall biosynthesis
VSTPKYAVRLLYDVPGWAYHRRCKALERYAPPDFYVTCGGNYGSEFKRCKYDLCLQLVYPCAKNVRRHIDRAKYNMVLVSGVNVAWEERGQWWDEAVRYSDWVVLNSRMAYEKSGKPPRVSYISNGIDREIFKPVVPLDRRQPRVLSIGSKFHQRNKGARDVLPRAATILKERGIYTDFRTVDSHAGTRDKVDKPDEWSPLWKQPRRLTAEGMVEWYNTGTVYVVASQREGTPNPALEAASCGCVLVATRCGNMPELIEDGVNGYLVDRNPEAIAEAVVKAQRRYAEMSAAMQERIASWHWGVRGEQYFDLFRRLIDERRGDGVSRMREAEGSNTEENRAAAVPA